MTSRSPLEVDATVFHPSFGQGTVLARSDGITVVVRFDSGIEQCPVADLITRRGVAEIIQGRLSDDPNRAIVRVQAEAIRSVNQQWGIFAPSRIQLLPHQLWVCKKVLERSPARWLVADDVGLGKTIEAGLILWPLVARGSVSRLLILCPASLVEQWQERMRGMFDLRMRVYRPGDDTDKSDYWNGNHLTIASLQTLRALKTAKHRARRERLLDAAPWDLVIVDEAHHLNWGERGETLGYRLLRELEDAGRLSSVLFFTATPHRGKNHGFFALLHLLRPDLFDPKGAVEKQLPHLRDVMIRNVKSRVTNLRGERIFERPNLSVRDFSYSDAERDFYDKLTDFILQGRAYASTLSPGSGQAVSLVLIALQKLAASSVAAVWSAIRNRIARLNGEIAEGKKALAEAKLLEQNRDLDEGATEDDRALWEEGLVSQPLQFQLLENELPFLQELLEAADAVTLESKLARLDTLLDEELRDRSVLMFTEYKATQGLVVAMLRAKYGADQVSFINGDHALQLPGSTGKLLRVARAEAAGAFNAGKVRFLISTEAAGEGVDLQESCHTLIHLDVPWNPMRIHQRNGRLVRYGQAHIVDILTLRNPKTVEARIWALLEEKMRHIEQALDEVTDHPEDLTEIVLGMTRQREYASVFEGALGQPREKLEEWFEANSASFGGKSAIDTVKSMFGSAAAFDFQQVSDRVPRADLPDLEPFMRRTMRLLGRRFVESDGGMLSVKRPDEWKAIPGVRAAYSMLCFERNPPSGATALSCGHKLVLQAIEWATKQPDAVVSVRGIGEPLIVVKVRDQDTTSGTQVPAVVCAVQVDGASGAPVAILRDWELLQKLAKATVPVAVGAFTGRSVMEAGLAAAPAFVEASMATIDAPFRLPKAEAFAAFWPRAQPEHEEVVEGHRPPV